MNDTDGVMSCVNSADALTGIDKVVPFNRCERDAGDSPDRVHWVRPELVAEVKFLMWTDDNLLHQVVYEGPREDKSALAVQRRVRHRKRS